MSNASKDRELLDIIGRLYDAAFDDALWAGIAPAVARLFDAPSATLHVRYPDSEAHLLGYTENLMPSSSSLREQGPYWRRHDVWVKRAREVGMGKVVLSADLFADAFFENTTFYQDWCRHLEIFHLMGAMFALPGGQLGGFGVHRPHDGLPFDEEQRRVASLFLPHYRRALDMRRQFQLGAIEKEAIQQTVRHHRAAVLALNAHRRVLYACPRAEALLREADGLRLLAGQVVIAVRARMDSFERRIAAALFWADAPRAGVQAVAGIGQESGSLAVPRPGRLPLILSIQPLRPPSLRLTIPAVLVLAWDPETVTLNPADLKELFGLTQAEALVACRLAEGLPLETIAEMQGIGLSTVRSHLKSILSKTDTTRQAEAVALILKCAAPFSAYPD